MNIQFNFSTCLHELQNTLNISNNKLAKAISVDPSLISKWRTGKREISTNSNYIDLLSNYISKNIKNKDQMDKIVDISVKYNVLQDTSSYNNSKEFIRALLIASLVKPLEETNLDIETSLKHTAAMAYGNVYNYNLITGHKNVIYAGIEFLKSLPQKPNHINTPILITFLTDSDSFSDFNETILQWNTTLKELQNKGWSINKVIRIDPNKNRNKNIIDEMLLHLETNQYTVFYLNNYDYLFDYREYILVPEIGAMMCLYDEDLKKIDSAFLFTDRQALKPFEIIFKHCFAEAVPLITHRYSSKNKSSLDKFISYEEFNGNRFTCNSFVDYVTASLEFYEKIMLTSVTDFSKEEIDAILYNIKKLKNTFIKQIEIYKFNNIFLKNSIVNITKNYELFSHTSSISDIIQFLKNYVYLLETYDNFNVALLNDCNANIINNFSWTIKESNSVFIHNLSKGGNDMNNVCILITEPTLVNAFAEYSYDIWHNIAPINKDKNSVISWLKTEIKSLENLQ